MILIGILLFRVVPPEHAFKPSQNKITIKKTKFNCDVNPNEIDKDFKITTDEYIFCGPKNGPNVNEFKVENCIFQSIRGARKKGNFIIGCENHHFFLNNNSFIGCTAYDKIIKCSANSDNYYFKLYSNIFSDCHHPDDNKKSITILTESSKNDFQNNTFTYLDKAVSQRSLEINYYKDCKMIGNRFTNTFHTDGSAIKFNEPGSGTNDLEIADCVFTSCQGDNKSSGHKAGLIIIIEKLNFHLKIFNTTFKNCKPSYVAESPETAYFVRFETDQSTPPSVTFSNCTFSYIETGSKAGGGIGFAYRNTEKKSYSKTLTFEYTIFEHLYNYHDSVGGGALAIESSFNEAKETNLNIIACSFYNVTSKAHGGAVFYDSPNSAFKIESSNFTKAETKNDNTLGGSIYALYQSSNTQISIKNCNFNNTHSHQGGAIYIQRNENSDSSAPISIENCLFLNTLSIDTAHSIMIDKSNNDEISISYCDFIDCGENQNSYTNVFNAAKLSFCNNKMTFNDSTKNCGCIELRRITEHIIKANTFCNAGLNDNKIYYSAGIHYDSWNDLTSIVVEDNIFDSFSGNNEGRCLFITIIKEAYISINNNTIQNCPSGGPLAKIWFRSRRDSFTIKSFVSKNNTMNDFRDQWLGCTPQFWIENTREIDDNHIDPIEITFEECNFSSNSNPTQGGALRFGKNKFIANIKVCLYKCNFIDNSAEHEGGAVYIQTYQGCKIDDCYFIDNKSNQGSGSIFIETEFQCINPSNSAEYLPKPSEDSRKPDIIINNCHFEGDSGKDSHGIHIGECQNAPVQLFMCVFNDCGQNGFVVSIQSKVQNIEMKNCTIEFSSNENSASGLISLTDKIVLIGNTFQNCNKNTVQIEGLINENNEIQIIENNFFGCKGKIINVLNLYTTKPVFTGNKFENISLECPIIEVKLSDSIDRIDFINNTFSNFVVVTENINGIGLEINHENNDKEIYISFSDCYFIDYSNQQKSEIGGALCCASNQNKGNIYLTLEECNFEGNSNSMNGGAIYINIKHDITITKCTFIGNNAAKGGSIYIQPDFNGFSEQSNINILECTFQTNGAADLTSIYIAEGSTKTLNVDSCTFTNDIGSVFIDNYNNKVKINNDNFVNTKDRSALIISQTKDLNNEILIDYCTFDSCLAPTNKCFDFVISTLTFTFRNSVVKNMIGTGENSYFGSFSHSSKNSIYLQNITFVDNIGNSLYGGGAAFEFIGISQLNLVKCNFTNNKANQNRDASRPKQENQKDYYNGDGGAIQLGYSCQMNDMNVLFSECIFINNKASRHGGALAIQTHTIVTIEECIFENNVANYIEKDSELLYENHFDKKSEGRGGAIYINPAYSYDDKTGECQSSNIHMTNVKILECDFIKNNAFDGYAIYIEGDDPGTEFNIKSNDFIDNYNENNFVDDKNIIYGAVITTEICTLIEKNIIENNNFTYSDDKINVKELSCVDHFGKTETKHFTESSEFTKSNIFSSHYFSPSNIFSYSQKFSQSDDFTKSSHFSGSSSFTKSSTFSSSSSFTKSSTFSSSSPFTKSSTFSSSSPFTKSSTFSSSSSFTKSNDFTKSSGFTSSNPFTKSRFFSPSFYFTQLSDSSFTDQNTKSETNDEYSSETDDSEMISSTISDESSSSNDDKEISSSTINDESSSSNDDKEISSSTINDESSSSNDDKEISSSTINDESSSNDDKMTSNSISNEEPSTVLVDSEIIESQSINADSEISTNIDGESTLPVDPTEIASDEPIDSPCAVSKNNVDTQLGNRCQYSADENDKSVVIHVLRTNFTDYKNESNGGAIYIFNCGFYIHKIIFTRCLTLNGGGGAIYIKETHALEHNITFDACLFTGCKAVFGGACYIYCSSDVNDVTITGCTFSSNVAYKRNSNNDGSMLYGGSSLFLTVRNSFIGKSNFVSNKGPGGSIKIYNKYDEETSKVSSLEFRSKERINMISDCHFENEEKSETSIFYVNDKDGSKIELNQCTFKGKLGKDSYYIIGELLAKDAPKIHIKSCDFEDKSDSPLNQKLINNEIVIGFKEKSGKKYGFAEYHLISTTIYLAAFVVTILIIILKFRNYAANNDFDDKIDDSSLNKIDEDKDSLYSTSI